MGAGSSKLRPVPDSIRMFSCRFNGPTLNVVHAQQAVLDCIAHTLPLHWPGGVASQRQVNPIAHEFVLAGTSDVWLQPEAIALFCQLVTALARIGYRMVAAVDLFLTMDDAELMFAVDDDNVEEIVGVFGVYMNNGRHIDIYQADQNANELIIETVKAHFKVEAEEAQSVCHRIILEGNPLRPNTEAQRRHLAMGILRVYSRLREAGYVYRASACLDGEQDVWFFEKASKKPDKSTCEYALMMPFGSNKVTCYGWPAKVFPQIRKIFADKWPEGLKDAKAEPEWFEFELNGDPWVTPPHVLKLQNARRLMMKMFRVLEYQAWALECALDISEEPDDKSVFLFRRAQPCDAMFLSVQPVAKNHLWLIDAPKDVVSSVNKVFSFLLGVKQYDKQRTLTDGTTVIEIDGTPWAPDSIESTYDARHITMVVVAVLMARGYHVLCAMDIQGDVTSGGDVGRRHRKASAVQANNEAAADVHTIVFRKY